MNFAEEIIDEKPTNPETTTQSERTAKDEKTTKAEKTIEKTKTEKAASEEEFAENKKDKKPIEIAIVAVAVLGAVVAVIVIKKRNKPNI